MSLLTRAAALVVCPLVKGACKVLNVPLGEGAVAGAVCFLSDRFTDQSKRLSEALEKANDRAWSAIEGALTGDAFVDRFRGAVASGDEKAFRERLLGLLDRMQLPQGLNPTVFRQRCREQLRAARSAGFLGGPVPAAGDLAQQVGAFARFDTSQKLLDAESAACRQAGTELSQAGYGLLAFLVELRPTGGEPLLVLAARYFFYRLVG
jgi:hypothetical protein